MKRSVFLLFLLVSTGLHAFEYRYLLRDQRILLFPEMYYAKRTRDGGTKQSGWLFGGHLNYDRLKPQGIYWGLEGSYALGDLSGKSGTGKRLESDFKDSQIEGRLGWTFCCTIFKPILFTAYGSYGHIYNENEFQDFNVKFDDAIDYYGGGFLAKICLSNDLTLGINCGYQSMYKGKSKLAKALDQQDEGSELIMNNRDFYTVELPVTYNCKKDNRYFQAMFVPFYRLRHFGGRENTPQDFISTRYRHYGIRATVSMRF